MTLEAVIARREPECRPAFNQGLSGIGVDIHHHFGDDGSGVYVKETRIPAGVKLGMHQHTFTHKSALVAGHVAVTVNGARKELHAPALLTLKSGDTHEVEALAPSVWLCIHATDETDPKWIDHALVNERPDGE